MVSLLTPFSWLTFSNSQEYFNESNYWSYSLKYSQSSNDFIKYDPKRTQNHCKNVLEEMITSKFTKMRTELMKCMFTSTSNKRSRDIFLSTFSSLIIFFQRFFSCVTLTNYLVLTRNNRNKKKRWWFIDRV
jgi:hypothetical protein